MEKLLNMIRILSFILLVLPQTISAEALPKWAIGFGVGGVHQSYYTGTKQTRSVLFPVPLLVYRGDTLKSDDEGIRAELFKDDRYKLDFSFDFNLAVKSEDIDLRQGMSDINSLLQIGPSVEVTFKRTKKYHFKLDLPVRAVFEIGGGEIDEAGYNFSPRLAYTHYFKDRLWRASFSLAPQFGTQSYHNVYYGVEADEVTPNRPAYTAGSGYSGSRFQFAVTSKNNKRLIVLFMRYDNIDGAEFEASPLVETKDNVTLGFIYSYYFLKSKNTVRSHF